MTLAIKMSDPQRLRTLFDKTISLYMVKDKEVAQLLEMIMEKFEIYEYIRDQLQLQKIAQLYQNEEYINEHVISHQNYNNKLQVNQLNLLAYPREEQSDNQNTYDWLIDIDVMSQVSLDGWAVHISPNFEQNPIFQNLAQKQIHSQSIIAITGLYNSGKTFVLNKITGNNLQPDVKINSKGISFQHIDLVNQGDLIFIDTIGLYSSINITNELSVLEREASEKFKFDLVHELADYFIYVVNEFITLDQRYLDKLIRQNQVSSNKIFKEIIVVHNLKDIQDLNQLKNVWDSQITQIYRNGSSQNSKFSVKNTINNQLQDKNIIWYKTQQTRHVCIINDNSQLGTEINALAFCLIRQWIQQLCVPSVKSCSIVQVIMDFTLAKLQKYSNNDLQISLIDTINPLYKLIKCEPKDQNNKQINDDFKQLLNTSEFHTVALQIEQNIFSESYYRTDHSQSRSVDQILQAFNFNDESNLSMTSQSQQNSIQYGSLRSKIFKKINVEDQRSQRQSKNFGEDDLNRSQISIKQAQQGKILSTDKQHRRQSENILVEQHEYKIITPVMNQTLIEYPKYSMDYSPIIYKFKETISKNSETPQFEPKPQKNNSNVKNGNNQDLNNTSQPTLTTQPNTINIQETNKELNYEKDKQLAQQDRKLNVEKDTQWKGLSFNDKDGNQKQLPYLDQSYHNSDETSPHFILNKISPKQQISQAVIQEPTINIQMDEISFQNMEILAASSVENKIKLKSSAEARIETSSTQSLNQYSDKKYDEQDPSQSYQIKQKQINLEQQSVQRGDKLIWAKVVKETQQISGQMVILRIGQKVQILKTYPNEDYIKVQYGENKSGYFSHHDFERL